MERTMKWHEVELAWRIRQMEAITNDIRRVMRTHDEDTRLSLLTDLEYRMERWLEYLHWQQDTRFEGADSPPMPLVDEKDLPPK